MAITSPLGDVAGLGFSLRAPRYSCGDKLPIKKF